MWISGEFKDIAIDDFVPVIEKDEGKYELLTLRSTHPTEIWVPLAHKAWAKACGSFQRAQECSFQECLQAFTGAPVTYLRHDFTKKEDIAMRIREGIHHGAIVIGHNGHEQDEFEKATGNNVFEIGRIEDVEAHQTKIIGIRDDQRRVDWKGEWSKHSEKWTPELREKLGVDLPENNSTFYMGLSDYFCYFNATIIAHVASNQQYSGLRVTHGAGSYALVKIEVTDSPSGHAFFGVTQLSRNHIPSSLVGDYKPDRIRLILGKQTASGPLDYM